MIANLMTNIMASKKFVSFELIYFLITYLVNANEFRNANAVMLYVACLIDPQR